MFLLTADGGHLLTASGDRILLGSGDAPTPARPATPEPRLADWRRRGPDPTRALTWRRRGDNG